MCVCVKRGGESIPFFNKMPHFICWLPGPHAGHCLISFGPLTLNRPRPLLTEHGSKDRTSFEVFDRNIPRGNPPSNPSSEATRDCRMVSNDWSYTFIIIYITLLIQMRRNFHYASMLTF